MFVCLPYLNVWVFAIGSFKCLRFCDGLIAMFVSVIGTFKYLCFCNWLIEMFVFFTIGIFKCFSDWLNNFLSFFDWLVEMFVAVIGIFKCMCFVIGLLLKRLSFLLLAYLNVCFCVFFYNNGQSSFYSNVMNKSEYFNLFDFNYNSLSDSKIKQLVDPRKNKYVSYWNHTLQYSRKPNFYHLIKKNYNPSAYLDSTRKNPMRWTLVKLRTGCHNLRVKTGRFDKIPLEERICPL